VPKNSARALGRLKAKWRPPSTTRAEGGIVDDDDSGDGGVQLVPGPDAGAGEGAGTQMVRHLVPAPGVGADPRRRVRESSRAGGGTDRHRAAAPRARAAAATPAGAGCTGRIYTRDLGAILPTFDEALQALNRRLQH